jgi:hypothetical protein
LFHLLSDTGNTVTKRRKATLTSGGGAQVRKLLEPKSSEEAEDVRIPPG